MGECSTTVAVFFELWSALSGTAVMSTGGPLASDSSAHEISPPNPTTTYTTASNVINTRRIADVQGVRPRWVVRLIEAEISKLQNANAITIRLKKTYPGALGCPGASTTIKRAFPSIAD